MGRFLSNIKSINVLDSATFRRTLITHGFDYNIMQIVVQYSALRSYKLQSSALISSTLVELLIPKTQYKHGES